MGAEVPHFFEVLGVFHFQSDFRRKTVFRSEFFLACERGLRPIAANAGPAGFSSLSSFPVLRVPRTRRNSSESRRPARSPIAFLFCNFPFFRDQEFHGVSGIFLFLKTRSHAEWPVSLFKFRLQADDAGSPAEALFLRSPCCFPLLIIVFFVRVQRKSGRFEDDAFTSYRLQKYSQFLRYGMSSMHFSSSTPPRRAHTLVFPAVLPEVVQCEEVTRDCFPCAFPSFKEG